MGVFTDANSKELLCVARDDRDTSSESVDMMDSHIAFGSLAIAAFHTVVDLQRSRVGLASKTNAARESTSRHCAQPLQCTSSMQTYYPPLNLCEDPQCSDYFFLSLDDRTKMCTWTGAAPVGFGLLLATLVVLDLLSHRLYKQAISKASEFYQ